MVSVMIPRGAGGKGWNSFQKALKDLLSSEYLPGIREKAGADSLVPRSFVNRKRSYADVVCNKGGCNNKAISNVLVDGELLVPRKATPFTEKKKLLPAKIKDLHAGGQTSVVNVSGSYFIRSLRVELKPEGRRVVSWVFLGEMRSLKA